MFRLLFCSILFVSSLLSHAWLDIIEKHKDIIGTDTYALLKRQCEAFNAGKAPKIAADEVKQILIKECGDEVVDLKTVNHARIKSMDGEYLLSAHQIPEDIDERSDKYSCLRKGVFLALEQMLVELDNLAPHFGYEKGELEIYLFEGLRDIATQQVMFDGMVKRLMENQKLNFDDAYAETSKWISPYKNNVPVHSTGAAIDIALYSNKSKKFCNMGRFNKSGATAYTFTNAEGLTEAQKLNRFLFVAAATKAGLTNYLNEFWHFSFGDRYAAYWRQAEGEQLAIYGSV